MFRGEPDCSTPLRGSCGSGGMGWHAARYPARPPHRVAVFNTAKSGVGACQLASPLRGRRGIHLGGGGRGACVLSTLPRSGGLRCLSSRTCRPDQRRKRNQAVRLSPITATAQQQTQDDAAQPRTQSAVRRSHSPQPSAARHLVPLGPLVGMLQWRSRLGHDAAATSRVATQVRACHPGARDDGCTAGKRS